MRGRKRACLSLWCCCLSVLEQESLLFLAALLPPADLQLFHAQAGQGSSEGSRPGRQEQQQSPAGQVRQEHRHCRDVRDPTHAAPGERAGTSPVNTVARETIAERQGPVSVERLKMGLPGVQCFVCTHEQTASAGPLCQVNNCGSHALLAEQLESRPFLAVLLSQFV